jgi:transposase-like protein
VTAFPAEIKRRKAMTCHNRQSTCKRFGKHRNGLQRYRCSLCRKTFTEEHARPLDSMRLPLDKATAILQLMLEGMSIRAIERFSLACIGTRFFH